MIPKFRAWDNENKCWTNYAITDDLQIFYDKYTGCWHRKNKDRFVLVQSTGLKDKNGEEIYEGDIVKPVSFASWIGVVKYSPENAAYILDDHNNEFIRGENVYLSQFNEGLEVKGNIYENPELMEV
jgi:hypothetical protein|nr:MAG TPA: YopX protein [Caudoviricetes sp.]